MKDGEGGYKKFWPKCKALHKHVVNPSVCSSRLTMEKTAFRRKMTGWRFSPGGNWSQTGTATRSRSGRGPTATRPLREEQITASCWSRQVRSGPRVPKA